MTIFKIDEKIREILDEDFSSDLIDEETGEYHEELLMARLEELQMERTQKIENVACMIKELKAIIHDIESEINTLKERKTSLDGRVEQLEKFLFMVTGGTKVMTPRAQVGWRKSVKTVIDDENKIPDEYKSEKVTINIDKTKIKKDITFGKEVSGAHLDEQMNAQIK